MRFVGRKGFRRGVLVLPSLFTLGNLFFGFCAIMEATKGFQGEVAAESARHFTQAALFIAFSMVLDGLDGRVARLAHATSPLGIQLDSLADVVSFGVAPAILVYVWCLAELPRIGWAVAFVFTSCGALRLARFNVQAQSASKPGDFVGLPIPGGAGVLAALVYAWPEPPQSRQIAVLMAAWTVLVALLMVSTFRYRKIDLTRPLPLRFLVWIVLLLAVIRAYPEWALVSIMFAYALSGPALKLVGIVRRGGGEPEGVGAAANPPGRPAGTEAAPVTEPRPEASLRSPP